MVQRLQENALQQAATRTHAVALYSNSIPRAMQASNTDNNLSDDGEENPLMGELSERQFRESLDVLLEMTSSDDEAAARTRTSPLSQSLLSAATSAVLGDHLPPPHLDGTIPQQSAKEVERNRGDHDSKPAALASAPFAGSMATTTMAVPPNPFVTTTLPVPFYATSSLFAAQPVASAPTTAVPATTTVDCNTTKQQAGLKRRLSCIAPISEDEEDWVKRRQGRNAREQQRAQQITQQITQLRNLLQSFQLEFKPDKFTTLLTATNYIQELQKTSATLSAEHKSVVKTLQQTTEHLHHPPTTEAEGAAAAVVPYRGVFHACPTALCLINLDGRFLDANGAFERMHGVKTEVLVEKRKSLFNLIQRPDIEGMFCAMSELLSYHPETTATTTDHSMDDNEADSFVQTVRLVVDKPTPPTVSLRVCLIRSETGLPRYFNCVMLPASDGLQTTG